MIDFTSKIYIRLLDALQISGYDFQTFSQYLKKNSGERVVILRHDVDKMPHNSLTFAKIEQERGIPANYFFRVIPQSFQPSIIKEICDLGHEIGYHYEDMDLCRGNLDAAWDSFQQNLAKLRQIAPVHTVCMHGSPLSKHDNRSLWAKYDYRELGIVGEPYLDLDFTRVFYITDTGRKWNNSDASLRDKVKSHFQIKIKNTRLLIQLIQEGELPDQIMINTHPQRWNDNLILWTRELLAQSVKNVIKKAMTKNQARKKDMQ